MKRPHAQMLTPVALRARRTADAGEHAALGEQIDEPLGVQDTLRTVAGAADERFGPGCQSSRPAVVRQCPRC
jgi:hypothetical protein